MNDPSLWGILLSFFPSSNLVCLGLGPLQGFLAETAPFKGPQPSKVLVFWNFRDTRAPSRADRKSDQSLLTRNGAYLDRVFVKTHFYTVILDFKKPAELSWVSEHICLSPRLPWMMTGTPSLTSIRPMKRANRFVGSVRKCSPSMVSSGFTSKSTTLRGHSSVKHAQSHSG